MVQYTCLSFCYTVLCGLWKYYLRIVWSPDIWSSLVIVISGNSDLQTWSSPMFDLWSFWSPEFLISGVIDLRSFWSLEFFDLWSYWSLELLISGVIDLSSYWSPDFLISGVFDLRSFWSPELLISKVFDLRSFWSPELLISRVFDPRSFWSPEFLISGVFDLQSYWPPEFLISRVFDLLSDIPISGHPNVWCPEIPMSNVQCPMSGHPNVRCLECLMSRHPNVRCPDIPMSDVWTSQCPMSGHPNVRCPDIPMSDADIPHLQTSPADISSPMNIGLITEVARHRLAHDIWVILTVGSSMRDGSHPGSLCDCMTINKNLTQVSHSCINIIMWSYLFPPTQSPGFETLWAQPKPTLGHYLGLGLAWLKWAQCHGHIYFDPISHVTTCAQVTWS